MATRPTEPDWDHSEEWDEFEWERALKHSDHVAARYFRMLDRFGDLPDAESFIAGRLGEQNFFEFQDETFYNYEDWDEGEDSEAEEEEEEGDNMPGSQSVGPGDTYYFEACPVYQRARQIALGWCNIQASVLKPEDRQWGLGVLFRLGRILNYLSICIGDGTFERVPASIAFAKRAMAETNDILGQIDERTKRVASYRSILKLIREHLLETHDMMVTLLFDLRKREDDMPEDDADDDTDVADDED